MNTYLTRKKALAAFLGIDIETTAPTKYDPQAFEVGAQEYAVLTDAEATKRAVEYIRDSLWAFTPHFIASHSKALRHASDRVLQSLEKMQNDLCEDANEIVFAVIDDFNSFAEDAIKADGRGHFLSTYDGEEHEHQFGKDTFYIYRVN